MPALGGEPDRLRRWHDREADHRSAQSKGCRPGGDRSGGSGRRIEQILDRYLAPIRNTEMVTAANTIKGAAKIARAKPALTEKIVAEILEAEKTVYLIHGRLSPECNAVACGHAVAALGEIYEQTRDRTRVRDFIGRQLENPRAAVRKKAKVFFIDHPGSF